MNARARGTFAALNARPPSLARWLLFVAVFGVLAAALVWAALRCAYGSEAMALRVLCSAAVAGVVHWRVRATGHAWHGSPLPDGVAEEVAAGDNERWGSEIEHWVEPDPEIDDFGSAVREAVVTIGGVSMPLRDVSYRERMAAAYQPLVNEAAARVASNLPPPALSFGPFTASFDVASDVLNAFTATLETLLVGDPRSGKPRPGQWGWRAREKRSRRLDRGYKSRIDRKRHPAKSNRADRRRVERDCLEWQALHHYGIEAKPGEFTAALRDRILREQCLTRLDEGAVFTKRALEKATGGAVEIDEKTATVRIVMPPGTPAERLEEVRRMVEPHTPDSIRLEVV